MAFTLADDLAPELYPLAWLVGTWRGFGMLSYEDIEERNVVQEITVDHDGGPYLRVVTTLWEVDTEASQPVHHEMSGAEGYSLLTKGTQWSTETSYWRPLNPRTGSGATRVDLEVVSADPAGHLSLYLGAAEGPRVDLATDAVIAAPDASQLSGGTRMYGLVQSDLLWVWDLAAFGQPLASYVSGRLGRVEE